MTARKKKRKLAARGTPADYLGGHIEDIEKSVLRRTRGNPRDALMILTMTIARMLHQVKSRDLERVYIEIAKRTLVDLGWTPQGGVNEEAKEVPEEQLRVPASRASVPDGAGDRGEANVLQRDATSSVDP